MTYFIIFFENNINGDIHIAVRCDIFKIRLLMVSHLPGLRSAVSWRQRGRGRQRRVPGLGSRTTVAGPEEEQEFAFILPVHNTIYPCQK